MTLFNQANFGKPISEDLSLILRRYTDKFNRANVAYRTGISVSTIRDVVYRTNSLTKQNSKAIIELMKIALKNCDEIIINSTKAKDNLIKRL